MIRASTLTTIKPKTPQPITPDIAHIIGQAIIEAGRNSDKAALSIANALRDTPQSIPQPIPQPVIVQAEAHQKSWEFKIIRDSNGNMTSIKATSK